MKVIGREIKLDNKNNPKGQQQNDFILKSDTLKDLIKILILYSSIVFTDSDSEEKEKDYERNILENRNKPCMIDILPILVQISEEYLMPVSFIYQEYARKTEHYLESCSSKDCG